jgi:ABC-2 type transport system permease protein
MDPFVRHLRSLGRFWASSLASQTEYVFNFLIELVAMAANLVGSLFLLSLFYGDGHSLGGWSWEAALVVLGVYTLLDGLASSVLRPNLNAIVSQVQSGTLDFVLLKPIDSQFWLSTRSLSPLGLPEMATGLGLILWAVRRAGVPLQATGLAMAALTLLAGVVILYSLWFMVAATSIWFVKIWNATEVLRSVLVAGRYPVSAYPLRLRWVFTFVVPVAFLTTVPAEAILGRSSATWQLLAVMIAALSLLASRLVWRFALRFYTSASS